MRNWLLGISVLALGCGDNSRSCGPGTLVENGFCVPSVGCGVGTIADEETGDCVPDGSLVCTNGTRFDPETSSCQIDPSACQNGSVLVGGKCVDPTSGMIVDLEEGPEPNGLGILEDSAAPGGVITLPPAGAFVVHGSITPHDGMPDVDSFRVTVDGPTLLDISVDGVGGLAAGFGVIGGLNGEDGSRYGVDLGSDTSRRKVYLHGAGTAVISVGDVRTMFGLATQTGANAGGTGAYYLSVSAVAGPAPAVLSVPSTTMGSLANGEVGFYEATFPPGMHTISVETPSEFAIGALTLDEAGLGGFDQATELDGAPAEVTVNHQISTFTARITVDTKVAVGTSPVAFTLTIQ